MKRNIVLSIFVVILLMWLVLPTMADNKTRKIYFVGMARNFQDSITYITDINAVDMVAIDDRTASVANLEIYTQQLNLYLLRLGHQGYVCTTFFAKDTKTIEKLYIKLKRRVVKDRSTRLQPIPANEFSFKYVDPATIYNNANEQPADDSEPSTE